VAPVLLKAIQFHRYLAHSVGLDYLKCMIVFKSLHGLAPAYLIDEFSHSRDFHSCNTRHRDLLRLLLAWTTKYQGSFRFSGAKIRNTLPLDLRSEHDINNFSFGLKGTLDPSLTEPPLVLLYLVVPFFIFICLVCCFFFFIRGPYKPASLN